LKLNYFLNLFLNIVPTTTNPPDVTTPGPSLPITNGRQASLISNSISMN
jgi:hypothetical protein